MLLLKVSDVRSVVSRQHRSVSRLRSKLAGVADRKSPLISALQHQLSEQQADIARLRSALAAQQASFTVDEQCAHSVHSAGLSSIEANSRLALSLADTEVTALLEASNQLASFALVEAALQSKCSQLAQRNSDNERAHRQRLSDMRRDWDVSRQQLAEAASRARHDSERRYKQQVMAAINISYSRMSDEIAVMQHNAQAEVRQGRRLDDAIQTCRLHIAAEAEREREEQRQRADSQRSLYDVRLQLRQVKRDIVHEQQKLSAHTTQQQDSRLEWTADRQLRHERLESELRRWRGVRAVYERSVKRVRCVVAEADKARSSNFFQQLVEECIAGVKCATRQSGNKVPVAALRDEERQRILCLLFARIRQAEMECLRQQQQDSTADQPAATVVRAVREVAVVGESAVTLTEVAAHTGPSFFLTQHRPSETEQLVDSGAAATERAMVV